MIIGNYPLTWLVTVTVIHHFICYVYVSCTATGHYQIKLFELLMFIIGSAVFEHVGVLFTKTYSYDQNRLMMFGKIPLSTLMIEACIVYVAMIIFEYLDMPKWTSIWVVGFFLNFYGFFYRPCVHQRSIFVRWSYERSMELGV